SHNTSVSIGIAAGIVSGDDLMHIVHLNCDRRVPRKCFRLPPLSRAMDVKGEFQPVSAVVEIIAVVHGNDEHSLRVCKSDPYDIAGFNDFHKDALILYLSLFQSHLSHKAPPYSQVKK